MAKEKPEKKQAARSYHLKTASTVDTLRDVYFFNRFAIELVDEFRLIYLGAVVAGEVLSSHVVAIAEADVAHCFTSAKEYIGALASVSQDPPKEWDRPRTKKLVQVANVISLSYAGSVGEIGFVNFSLHDLAMVRRGVLNEFYGRRSLITRSSLELHKQFIGNLYKGME